MEKNLEINISQDGKIIKFNPRYVSAFGLLSSKPQEVIIFLGLRKPRVFNYFLDYDLDLFFLDLNLNVVEQHLLKKWRTYRPVIAAMWVLEVPIIKQDEVKL